jgi:hypothetical protein
MGKEKDLNRRSQRELDQALVAALTEACETAKSEVEGFTWVTHEADYHNFPASLQVVWVFETQRHLARALESGQGKRLYDLTASALESAGVSLSVLAAHVRFDSEEACQMVNGGNWQSRLDMLRSATP